jgi:integrase
MKVTLKERAAGHWRLRLEVGKDASGKRLFKYETVKGTREDAERRRFEILHAHEEGSYALPDKITLGAFFARWIETRRALNKIRRSTTENYACIFNTHIAPTLASSRLQSITGADIQNLYVQLAGRLSQSMLAHVHRVMAALFHAARKAKVLKVNPMDEVEAPVNVRPKPKALDEETARKLLQSLEGNWKYPITVLALTAGLRRGEVLGLRWKDFDPATGKLSINGQLVEYDDGTVERVTPKTANAIRTITLPPETVELLTTLRREAAELRLQLGRGGSGLGDTYMFTAHGDGETPVKPKNFGQLFAFHCDRHGLPGFTFQGARHTHLTALLRSVGKAGAKAVSQRAGHSDITTTLRVYQTVFEEDEAALAALASGLLNNNKK